ncbi:hypothetical protein KAI87_12925, partial [Myxococcota bacterium]|nr:hypothetical protein [Myxococcota bacterium]
KEEQERARRDAEELARQIEEEKAQKERDDGQRRAEEAYQLIEQAAQQAKEAEAQEKINALQKEAEEARMLADKAEQARQEEKEELKRRLETFKEENDKLLKNQLDESKREAEEKETLLRQQLESEMRERLEKEQREAEEKEKRERLEKEKKETEERDFRKRIEDETRARLDAEYRQREEAAQAISLQKINTENSEAQIEREIRERIESELRSQYGLLPADTAIEPRAPEFPTKPQVYPSQTTAPSPIEQQRPTATEFERPPLQAPEKPFGEFGQNEDIAIVFVRQWQAQTTGRVDFESDGHRKSVFFERGAPVDARSSQLFDRIEEYLFREGKISRAAYQDVRVKGLRGPRKIGSYLVRQGHLKAGELFTAIRGHLQQIIFGIFEWETGHYVWSGEHVEEDDRVALDKDPRALLTEAIRRKYSLTRMIDRLGPPSTLMGDGDPKNPVDLDAMLLLPGEKRITRLVDGTRNIEDLVFTSGAEAEEVYRTLIMLEAFGFIKIIVRGQEEQSENGRSASDEIDRERIREKVEQARHSDYFCVLGLNRNATPYEIDQAAKSMRQEFASSRYSTTVAEDLAPMIDEIQRVLDDAWQILREPGMRDSYASHLPVE